VGFDSPTTAEAATTVLLWLSPPSGYNTSSTTTTTDHRYTDNDHPLNNDNLRLMIITASWPLHPDNRWGTGFATAAGKFHLSSEQPKARTGHAVSCRVRRTIQLWERTLSHVWWYQTLSFNFCFHSTSHHVIQSPWSSLKKLHRLVWTVHY